MASSFIGFLVESKSEIRFRMASFWFSSCLMRKRVAKSEAILALLYLIFILFYYFATHNKLQAE